MTEYEPCVSIFNIFNQWTTHAFSWHIRTLSTGKNVHCKTVSYHSLIKQMHSSVSISEPQFLWKIYIYLTKYCIVEKGGKIKNQLLNRWVYMKSYCWILRYILIAYNLVPTWKRQDYWRQTAGLENFFFFWSKTPPLFKVLLYFNDSCFVHPVTQRHSWFMAPFLLFSIHGKTCPSHLHLRSVPLWYFWRRSE